MDTTSISAAAVLLKMGACNSAIAEARTTDLVTYYYSLNNPDYVIGLVGHFLDFGIPICPQDTLLEASHYWYSATKAITKPDAAISILLQKLEAVTTITTTDIRRLLMALAYVSALLAESPTPSVADLSRLARTSLWLSRLTLCSQIGINNHYRATIRVLRCATFLAGWPRHGHGERLCTELRAILAISPTQIIEAGSAVLNTR